MILHPHKTMSKIKKIDKMKIKLMIKRKTLIRGDKDDGDHQESRSNPPHPRVHQTVQRDHSVRNILSDIKKGVTTRSHITNFYQYYSFVSSMKPFKVEDVLHDLDWVVAMQEELNNFKRNQV
jgi:bifunctional ADP-heptose synthase (sugar kinase/adenylyltransferase)